MPRGWACSHWSSRAGMGLEGTVSLALMTSTFPGVGQDVRGVRGAPEAARPHCTPGSRSDSRGPALGLGANPSEGLTRVGVARPSKGWGGAVKGRGGQAGRPRPLALFQPLPVSTWGRAHPPHGGPERTHLWWRCR